MKQDYIHAPVSDAERQKMWKTKVNVLEPTEITRRYGTDAVRFTLAPRASPATDIAFSESRTEGYRAFANKIWNAARFMFMNADRADGNTLSQGVHAREMTLLENRWILSRFIATAALVNENLADYRFHEAANLIYNFFWGEFCDWYLEIIKPRLAAADGTAGTALGFLGYVFEGALRLLCPFMPFITEEIWNAMQSNEQHMKSIAFAKYPGLDRRWLDPQAEEQMAVLQEIIVNIRQIRADLKIEPRTKVRAQLYAGVQLRNLVDENRSMIERLAALEEMEFAHAPLAHTAGARTTPRFEVAVIYEQQVDVAAERERLSKELKKLEGQLASAQKQLGNEHFLGKAPAHIVEGLRKQAADNELLVQKTRSALDKLE